MSILEELKSLRNSYLNDVKYGVPIPGKLVDNAQWRLAMVQSVCALTETILKLEQEVGSP